MFRESAASGAFSFAELNYLRSEALDRFERCLTEGRAHPLESFVEEQLAQEPPRLELLREVAEDLHQHLLGLREHHFNVRGRALELVLATFGFDLSPMIPLQDLEHFHLLDINEVWLYLRQQGNLDEKDEIVLRTLLEPAMLVASQLHHDVEMTQNLYNYIMDWVMGLNTTVVRRYWADAHYKTVDEHTH